MGLKFDSLVLHVAGDRTKMIKRRIHCLDNLRPTPSAAKRSLSRNFKSALSAGTVLSACGKFVSVAAAFSSTISCVGTKRTGSTSWLCSKLHGHINLSFEIILAGQPSLWWPHLQNFTPLRLKWNSKMFCWNAAFMPPSFVVTSSNGYDLPVKILSTSDKSGFGNFFGAPGGRPRRFLPTGNKTIRISIRRFHEGSLW